MNRQKTDLTGSPQRKGLARDLGGDLGLLHGLSQHAHSVGFVHREPAIGNWQGLNQHGDPPTVDETKMGIQ